MYAVEGAIRKSDSQPQMFVKPEPGMGAFA